MKRRTFISMMSVMAAAGVLTLSGCSNSSTSTAASSGASSAAGSSADQLAAIQASGKLIVALEGAWQPWSYHDESDTLVGYDVEVSRAIAEKLGLDRTTAGKNLRPLEQSGLVEVASAKHDARQRAIRVTKAGHAALKAAVPLWRQAQSRFEAANGPEKAAALRETLRGLEFEPAS